MTYHDDLLTLIREKIAQFDVKNLVYSFDADFDLPFLHPEALGLLEMKGAFTPVGADADGPALAVRVGAFWCRIVSDDVRFDLAHALAAIERSQADAKRLRVHFGEFESYAAARWADGTGKVLYRTGSYPRGRILFQDACGIAEERGLWWCLPDMRSNYLRAQLQEAQIAGERSKEPVHAAVAALRAEITHQETVAAAEGVPLTGVPAPAPVRHREFARGYFSLLHNLSIALHQSGDEAGSVELAERGQRLATSSNDEYRQAQALLQRIQPLMSRIRGEAHAADTARELLDVLHGLRWNRGKLIARQQLAVLRGGAEGIRDLLGQIRSSTDEPGALTGLDVESNAFAATRALSLVDDLPLDEQDHWRKEIRRVQETVARSVRQVIALPAYKRSYSRAMRPVYLAGVRELMDEEPEGLSDSERWEQALALVEESTGRELLDLMASAALPTLGRPAPPTGRPEDRASTMVASSLRDPEQNGPSAGTTRSLRRSRPRRTRSGEAAGVQQTLLEREREFESQFLRNPLQAVAHDPEIARKAEGFVLNNPGTCIVRYFGFDAEKKHPDQPTRLGAFVIRGGLHSPVECGDYGQVRGLVDELVGSDSPSTEHARRIWELLLAPIWDAIAPEGQEPEHLLIVPSDELFAVPFHIAAPAGGIPLGARLPLSNSVSLAAYLLRSRHQLRRQRVEPTDNLAAMILRDDGVSGDELTRANWERAYLNVAGDVPFGLADAVDAISAATWKGLEMIAATRPEFFLYAGHGSFLPQHGQLGPYLQIEDASGDRENDVLTPFDVALRVRLPRNRLTILGACVAGQGAQTASGDVAGFLRAFMAARAGAIALPLWSVKDQAVATSAGHLLRASREAVGPRSSPGAVNGDGVYDVVSTLHRHYKAVVQMTAEQDWIDAMPLAIYT